MLGVATHVAFASTLELEWAYNAGVSLVSLRYVPVGAYSYRLQVGPRKLGQRLAWCSVR